MYLYKFAVEANGLVYQSRNLGENHDFGIGDDFRGTVWRDL